MPRSHGAAGKPVGRMSDLDWQDTVKTLRDIGRINSDIAPGQIYTNAFIPDN